MSKITSVLVSALVMLGTATGALAGIKVKHPAQSPRVADAYASGSLPQWVLDRARGNIAERDSMGQARPTWNPVELA